MGKISAKSRLEQTRKKLAELEQQIKDENMAAIKVHISSLKELGLDCVFYERKASNSDNTISDRKRKVLTPDHIARMQAGRKKWFTQAKAANRA